MSFASEIMEEVEGRLEMQFSNEFRDAAGPKIEITPEFHRRESAFIEDRIEAAMMRLSKKLADLAMED